MPCSAFKAFVSAGGVLAAAEAGAEPDAALAAPCEIVRRSFQGCSSPSPPHGSTHKTQLELQLLAEVWGEPGEEVSMEPFLCSEHKVDAYD